MSDELLLKKKKGVFGWRRLEGVVTWRVRVDGIFEGLLNVEWYDLRMRGQKRLGYFWQVDLTRLIFCTSIGA